MTNDNVLTRYQSEALEALRSAANLGKPFEKVIMGTLKLFMAIPDKKTFLNMGRYGMFSEQTCRNTFTLPLLEEGFHVVSRLRNDAALWYPAMEKPTGKRGHPRWYDGKIDFANLDPTRCVELHVDNGRLFGLKAYSKSLKHFIKVAIWYPIEGTTDKWQLYFSTDESMTTRDVINCYRTRFQLELCFRDAKPYAGLNDCQARDLRRLEFHFNASFTSINVACKGLGIPFSISSCKSVIHNAYMLERFICVSGLRPNPQVIDKPFQRTAFIYIQSRLGLGKS